MSAVGTCRADQRSRILSNNTIDFFALERAEKSQTQRIATLLIVKANMLLYSLLFTQLTVELTFSCIILHLKSIFVHIVGKGPL